LQLASQVPRFSFCDVFLLVDISQKTNQDKTKKTLRIFSTFIESFMIDQLILFFMFFGQKKTNVFIFILSFNGLDQGTLTGGEGSVPLTSSLR
jgi:hypothetical protein